MEKIAITRENLKLYAKHEFENNENHDKYINPDVDLMPIVSAVLRSDKPRLT